MGPSGYHASGAQNCTVDETVSIQSLRDLQRFSASAFDTVYESFGFHSCSPLTRRQLDLTQPLLRLPEMKNHWLGIHLRCLTLIRLVVLLKFIKKTYQQSVVMDKGRREIDVSRSTVRFSKELTFFICVFIIHSTSLLHPSTQLIHSASYSGEPGCCLLTKKKRHSGSAITFSNAGLKRAKKSACLDTGM